MSTSTRVFIAAALLALGALGVRACELERVELPEVGGATDPNASEITAARAAAELEPAARMPVDGGSAGNLSRPIELLFRLQVGEAGWDEHANGSVLAYWQGITTPPPMLSINDGLAVLPTLPSGSERRDYLQFIELRLNEQPANVIMDRTVVGNQTRVVVDCHPRISTIRVFGADNGTELAGITLCESGSWKEQVLEAPTQDLEGRRAAIMGSNLSSPINLENRDGTHIYFVIADGYAWTRVPVDHDSAGVHRVRLQAGGRVVVTIPPQARTPDGARLRFDRQPLEPSGLAAVCADAPAISGRATIVSGLRAGDWRARVEIGDPGTGALVLGETPFSIVAGGTTEVTIDFSKQSPSTQLLNLSGLLILPADQGVPESEFIVRALESWNARYARPTTGQLQGLERTAEPGNVLKWDFGLAQPGPYRLELPALQFGKLLHLDAAFAGIEVIDLSNIEEFSIQVTDRDTGLDVGVGNFVCSRPGAAEDAVRALVFSVSPDKATEPVKVHVRPGRYTFAITDTQGNKMEATADLLSGQGTVPLIVERKRTQRAEITCILECAGVKWPVGIEWWNRVRISTFDGQIIKPTMFRPTSTGMAQAYARCTFVIDVAADVRLEFPLLDDFNSIEPISVTTDPIAPTVIPVPLAQAF